MAYLVTARRGGLELRDGATAADPMHKLKEGVPVLFHNMPCGYRIPGDGQIVIEVAPERCEDIPVAPPVPMPMEVTPEPVEEQPRRRRGRKA